MLFEEFFFSIMSWVKEEPYNYGWLESLFIKILKCGAIPRHVAFIMDGNRRYAERHQLEKIQGHSEGFENHPNTLYKKEVVSYVWFPGGLPALTLQLAPDNLHI